ncbi:MAG: hypothetical protein VX589_16060 [Myxococcota bacterium]|nr:hypothetical protein [Myxococcota bacterium]
MAWPHPLNLMMWTLIVLGHGCGSVSPIKKYDHADSVVPRTLAVRGQPHVSRLPPGQPALFEAAFRLDARATSPMSLTMKSGLENFEGRFHYVSSEIPLNPTCALPTCGQIDLPGRPANEIAHWLAIVDYWWRIYERHAVQISGMQRRLQANGGDSEFFRQAISETVRVKPQGDLSCVIRRRIYFESESTETKSQASEWNWAEHNETINRFGTASGFNRWNGDGFVLSSEQNGIYELKLYYGATVPGRSDGQVILHGLVCNSTTPLWASRMGQMRIRTHQATGQTRVQHIPLRPVRSGVVRR